MGWGRFAFGAVTALSVSAHAAILDPIATTGHDADIIFENDGSPTTDEEIGSRWYFEEGLLTTGDPVPLGLPANPSRQASGSLLSGNTINYAFNDYGASNALDFEGTALGPESLTLTTPSGFTNLAVAYSGGSMPGTGPFGSLAYTINYAGGGTQTGSFTVPDWSTGTLPTGVERLLAVDRANTGPVLDGSRRSATRWGVYVTEITPNSSADILSITFTATLPDAGSGDDIVVFGLAGTQVPEPSSLALLGAGALGLRRRRLP